MSNWRPTWLTSTILAPDDDWRSLAWPAAEVARRCEAHGFDPARIRWDVIPHRYGGAQVISRPGLGEVRP